MSEDQSQWEWQPRLRRTPEVVDTVITFPQACSLPLAARWLRSCTAQVAGFEELREMAS